MSHPVTSCEQARPLLVGLDEDAAEELAKDHRVHDRGAVLTLDRRRDVRGTSGEAIVAPGEVRLVGSRAVVVGAAGVDREAECHRLQGAGLVSGQFQTLDVAGEGFRAAADLRRGTPGPLGQ